MPGTASHRPQRTSAPLGAAGGIAPGHRKDSIYVAWTGDGCRYKPAAHLAPGCDTDAADSVRSEPDDWEPHIETAGAQNDARAPAEDPADRRVRGSEGGTGDLRTPSGRD